jgi:hypothetical protein
MIVGKNAPVTYLMVSLLILTISAIIVLPTVVSADAGESEEGGGFHIALMYLAAFLGLLVALTGMSNSRIRTISKLFPKIIPRIYHRWLALLYYTVFFGTFIAWSINFYSNRGQIYFTLHGQVGLLSFILAIAGIITGLIMWKRPVKIWKFHWGFNMASYVLLIVTIILGQALGD